jgi:hypothetical protein
MAIFIITVVQATYRIWRSKCGRSVDEGIDNVIRHFIIVFPI